MSVRVVAVCDLCQAELPVSTGGEMVSEAGLEFLLERAGWSVREDALRHLCPAH